MSDDHANLLAVNRGSRTRPAIIVPVSGETGEAVLDAAADTIGHAVDIVEWRADGLDELSPESLTATAFALDEILADPLLLTVRTRTEGGSADVDDETYAELVLAAIDVGNVAFVDVEFRRDAHVVARLVDSARAAGIGVILSAHDFDATPPKQQLRELFEAMCSVGPDVVKVAVMPQHARDVLALLDVSLDVREAHPDQALMSIAMGALGVVSRIAASTFGSVATFGAVGRASAPGQVDADELRRMLDVIDIA
ncbi:MAG: type I 3-dehydroquinate dehydratase [Cryobacterium sp.]|nr:type I 3-dehydroquinate dehydratase [Cryobacterium sp.]